MLNSIFAVCVRVGACVFVVVPAQFFITAFIHTNLFRNLSYEVSYISVKLLFGCVCVV